MSHGQYECRATSIDNSHHDASRASRSPSAVSEAVTLAEYLEWAIQGFLKRTRIGDAVTYHLEFKLPSFSELLYFPSSPEASGLYSRKEARLKCQYQTSHSAVVYSKTRPIKSRLPTKRILWTEEEDDILVRMKEDGCSWEEISDALPFRTPGAIQVYYSTQLGGCTRTRKR